MAMDLLLPQLEPDMTEAKIARWLISEGAFVEKGEPILEIETDKAVVEIVSPYEGYMGPIQIPENSVSQVGEILTTILAHDEIESAQENNLKNELTASVSDKRAMTERDVSSTKSHDEIRISPHARRIAIDLQVDLSSVKGTGAKGRIVAEDVKRAADQAKKGEPDSIVATGLPLESLADIPMEGVRRIIANKLSQSHRTSAPVTLTIEVNASNFVELREQLNTEFQELYHQSLSYNAMFIKLVAVALHQFPYMNSRLDEDTIKHLKAINIGLAIDIEGGLIVPVIKSSEVINLADINRQIQSFIERAPSRKFNPDEIVGSTFTVTNLGMFEIEMFTPILNSPEAAVLGIGTIKERPIASDGQISIVKTVWLSLTFDHRLVDGAPAARFLQHIKELIEAPTRIPSLSISE